MTTDDLAKRRVAKAKLKANYQSGVVALLDPVIAAWQQVWVEDCKQKGRTIPFAQWCLVPLDDSDTLSSPFEIANVYTPETFRE